MNSTKRTKGNQDVLNPKDFNILVARVNGLEQELEEIKQKSSSLRNIFATSLIFLFSSSAIGYSVFGYSISEMLSSLIELIK
jgi:hypothetical protein